MHVYLLYADLLVAALFIGFFGYIAGVAQERPLKSSEITSVLCAAAAFCIVIGMLARSMAGAPAFVQGIFIGVAIVLLVIALGRSATSSTLIARAIRRRTLR
jgi:hypothetical protein